MRDIAIAKPFLDSSESEAVLRVLKSGWISSGPVCEAFEKKLAGFVGVRFAKAVNSGTSAIQLALLACEIKPGDEVIVPAFTCVAALNPIEHIGAHPVLVDIELDTFSMDPDLLVRKFSTKTKAVAVGHLFGLPAPMDRIMNAVRRHRIKIIEDAALGLGGRISGRNAGSFGEAAVLSFHPRKIITTGEGGMVLTNSPEINSKVAALRSYGASVQAWKRHHKRLFDLPQYEKAGFNYKLSDILAAVGLEQAKKLGAMIKRRRVIASRYDKAFSDIPWLAIPSVPDECEHAYQSYVCLLKASDPDVLSRKRSRLFSHLKAKGISSVQGAQSMAEIAFFRRKYGWRPEAFPKALLADRGTLALPIYPSLSESDQERVIKAVLSFRF